MNPTMTKNKLILCIAALLLSACSNYKIGNVIHPQIKTVAIGKIKNLTDEPRLAFYIKSKLKERFMLSSSVKLVPIDQADIIISGVVRDYQIRASSSASLDYREKEDGFFAAVFSSSVNFSYDIKTRNQWDVQKGSVSGIARYTEFLDQQEEKRNALKRAAYDASKKLVSNITEGW